MIKAPEEGLKIMPGCLQGSSISDPDGVHPAHQYAVEIEAGVVLDTCEDEWFVIENNSKTEECILFIA